MSDEESDENNNDAEQIFSEMVEIAEEEGVIDSATAEEYKDPSRNLQKEDARNVAKGFARGLISDKDTDEEDESEE